MKVVIAEGAIVGNLPIEYLLIGASVLLLLSIVASRFIGSWGIPSLLIFLLIGMLAGSDGLGGIYFDDPWVAQSLGVVALVFILFAGGLDTDWHRVRPVLGQGLILSTLGVLITTLLVGLFVSSILHFSFLEGLLVGAIVSSTDAAAVFGILRSKKFTLKGDLKPLLEFESGSNDPMAVFLTLGLIHLLTKPGSSAVFLIPMFIWQMALGALGGYGAGKIAILIVNHIKLEYEGLYPVLTMALTLLTYGGITWLGGNGFLAIYIAGLVLGNGNFIHKKSLIRFHDGLGWLMQISMFLTLGLLVFPSRLASVLGSSLLIAAFLILAGRPISVFLSLLFSPLSVREKTLVSWVGLRGAVPIVLATFPLLAGLAKAEIIFNIVFFIVLTSVLLQGTSIPLVARWLKTDAPLVPPPKPSLEFAPACDWKSELLEIKVPPDSPAAGKQILELGLPEGALIILVSKAETCLIPSGSTILDPGDQLLIFAAPQEIPQIRGLLGAA
jgi:potassium/hydrogen antiporter